MAAFRSVLKEGVLGVRWGYFKGINAKNLRLHLKVLDIEEVYFFAMAFQELETVRYRSEIRTGRRRNKVNEVLPLRGNQW